MPARPPFNPRAVENLRPDGALKHGAHSEGKIAPLAAMYLDELRLERPGSSERVLRIQSRRLARLDLLAGHEDRHGVLRHQRRGEPYPATLLAEKIASAYIAADRDLEARERDADAPNARQALDQLREVGRAIAQAREADDG